MGRVGMRAAAESTGTSTRRVGHPGPVVNYRQQPTTRTQAHLPWTQPTSAEPFVSNKQERALKLFRTLTAAGFVAAAAIGPAMAIDISGAGATFPYPIYAKWADAYKKETGVGMNYQSIGSGGGIKQIKAKTVTFGASDAPLTGKELDETGLAQFPAVMGGIVPVVNLEGVKPDELVIDGPTLANVHRSDGSGTTYNFVYYLSDVSADWKSKVGVNTSVQWPVGIGAKGNEGVANNVMNTKGSIGYVEYAYAKQNKL